MSRTLSALLDAIEQDLGEPLADVFEEGFFERCVNEGQARFEPQLYRRRRVANVVLSVDDESFELPEDVIVDAPIEWVAAVDSRTSHVPGYRMVDETVYFNRPICTTWTGTVFYRAHFPEITDGQDCLLPPAACDGLVQFALYRAFRKLAAGRSEYRKYATIVGNGVAMADLEQAASIHLEDFNAALVSAQPPREPVSYYED